MVSDLIGGLTEQNLGFVAREVLVELVWVLERSFQYERSEIARVLVFPARHRIPWAAQA